MKSKNRRCFPWVILVVVCMLPGTKSRGDDSSRTSQQIGEINFSIPQGLRLERVADESLTTWPMLVDWDRNGDLLVVESGGVERPIQQHNQQGVHRIVRLADKDGDGDFDQRTVVAEDLPFTEGVLCIGEDLLITSPPVIYRLTDRDASGVYQSREVWFDGQTITGCANDLHGPYLGRDGWIYWSKGAFAEQTHEVLDGEQLTTSAAHIFRRRLSGGKIEPVMTGGMDNPCGFAMTPEGERFFTSTFLHHPGNGLRDGIVHSVYGGLHGKSHNVLEGHWRTGPLMPVTVELGPAAPSGMLCLESDYLLPDAAPHRTLIAALYNLQKVTAHRLIPDGASFRTENQDLVVADRIDFHPTDVLEDGDGSLLIVDTGGWYDLCCPSSRVDQQAASGGIYRLSRADSAENSSPPPPRNIDTYQEPSIEQLVESLADPRRWIARQAQHALRTLPDDASTRMVLDLDERVNNSQLPLDERLDYLWGLAMIATDDALMRVTALLSDDDNQLAQAACHAVSVTRFQPAKKSLERILSRRSPLQLRRAAAEALGRIGDQASTRVLFKAAGEDLTDRHWQHSITYALLELDAVQAATESSESDQSTAAQLMVAMTVLDQLGESERLEPAAMVRMLESGDAIVRDAAIEVLARHPQWAGRFESLIERWFRDVHRDGEGLVALVRGWRRTEQVANWLGSWLADTPEMSQVEQVRMLRLIETFESRELPASWEPALARWLSQSTHEIRSALLKSLVKVKLSIGGPVAEKLLRLAGNEQSAQRTLELLAALPPGSRIPMESLADAVVRGVASQEPALNATAFTALERVRMGPKAGERLLELLDQQPASLLMVFVQAINRIENDDLDRQLLSRLVQVPAAKTLPVEQLTNLYRQRSESLQEFARQITSELQRSPEDIEAKVEEVMASLPSGDALRGLQLFRSGKASCSACHRLGYVGGEIGPELTRIIGSRTRRALLEAILFPNARVEQGYQATKILTTDGRVLTGLVVRHLDPTTFVLQVGVNQTEIVRQVDIERQEPASVSIMPSGMDEVLTLQELADLLAVLEATR
jgi:putative membrane-bound dehydrogenase-like protein